MWYKTFGELALFRKHSVLRSVPVLACPNNSFLLIAESYSRLWIYHSLFNHPPIEEHFVSCFEQLQIKFYVGINAQRATAGLCGKRVFSCCCCCCFSRICPSIPRSGYRTLHSHQQCMRNPVSQPLQQHLVFSQFFILAVIIDKQ